MPDCYLNLCGGKSNIFLAGYRRCGSHHLFNPVGRVSSLSVGAVSRTVLVSGSGDPVEALASALEDESVSVSRAPDAVTALERLEAGGVDCVVSTVSVGELDGGQFLSELRSRGYGLPVVLLATESEVGTVLHADFDRAVPADEPAAAARGVADVLAGRRLDDARAARRRLRSTVSNAGAEMAAADTRTQVEQALASTLADGEVCHSAWVGRYDATDETVVPTVAAGLPAAHLADRPVHGATAAAVEEGEIAVEGGGGNGVTIAVPLGSEPLGVLYVNADRDADVSDVHRDLLGDLGATAADAIRRVEGEDGVDASGLTVLGDALAHELSNHLDVAITHLDLARDADEPDEHFGHVEDALDRMAGLADEARALARGEVDVEDCALAEVSQTAWARVAPTDAELEAHPGRVRADETQLTLLLENLLRNAVEHGPETETRELRGGEADDEPPVRVVVEPLDDEEGFRVADDGRGIPPEERESVLEWGYAEGEGAGVGLGIVRLVADRHDWTVEVGESDLGGASFTFR